MLRLKVIARGVGTLGALTLVASLAVGCTAASAEEVELPPKNQSEWVLPLDGFVYVNAHLRDYAEALLEKPCYAQYGIEWPVPWQPKDATAGPSYSAGLQRLFNEQLASQFGYHKAPNEFPGSSQWRDFVAATGQIAESTPGFDSIMEKCQDVSRDQLPIPSDETLYFAQDAAAMINDKAKLDVNVLGAGKKWASCMADNGYPGLPPRPRDVPTPKQGEKWKVGVPGTEAGPAEIAMAVADAKCLESSEWSAAFYESVWDLQSEFVNDNASRLVRIRTELEADTKRLLDAVAEHAPSR